MVSLPHPMVALRAVLRTPRTIETQLPSLLAIAEVRGKPAERLVAARTVRLAHRLLARTSWLPGHRWKASCLYRSVSECLVLRELGYPARVFIGARVNAPGRAFEAHAWVECDGISCASTVGTEQYKILASASVIASLR